MWICINMQKIRVFHWFVLEICLIKKFCNLIDWEHFGPYLWNINFPKFSNKLKKNLFFDPFWAHFPNLWSKKICLENPALPSTTSHGILAPCQISEKKLMIQFQENTWREGQKDGRTDRPYFIGPFLLPPRVQYTVVKIMPCLILLKSGSQIHSKFSVNNDSKHKVCKSS